MNQVKCPYCGTVNNLKFWIPYCCIEGYFMLPLKELTEEDKLEYYRFSGKSVNRGGIR